MQIVQDIIDVHENINFLKIVTGPGKIGLIYTKYTCSYYGKYLLFCICYPISVCFIEFVVDLWMYDDVLGAI